MDRLLGTYKEDFPVDKDGNRVKNKVFESYPFRRGVDGNIIRT